VKDAQLIYTKTKKPVKIGDVVKLQPTGELAIVDYFAYPHKPSSSGKVSVKTANSDWSHEVYVSVIGAEWINRTD
jgi:hypothetical protein